jgi:CRISPR/Cas system CMR subunit Cmr6 (Cas7 group RAMP superfamily)
MIQMYIKNAIKDVEQLIDLTLEDITDIKEANHDKIADRVSKKNHLAISFETNKSLLNDELSKKAKDNSLEEILSTEDRELLEQLKEKLSILKEKNREYAKYVIKLNEFYTSLFDEMFKLDREGYDVANAKPATILTVSA